MHTLKTWMKENRDAYFKKFPDPSCPERGVWRQATAMRHNAREDGIGGESGIAETAENKTLSALKKRLGVYDQN